MSIFEDTNPRALKSLLSEIHQGVMALPDFQRDFVWEPSATQELIVSIANNYPAGSLLRVRDSRRIFAAREFEGAPPLDGRKHTFLVLDGQQRLTSLYQAFYGVGEHRFYLDLNRLIEGAEFEEAIFHVRASTRWAKARQEFSLQAEELLLPLSVLQGGAGGFLQWLLQVTNPMPADERTRLLDALTAINERWIKTIDDYHFPVVTLSETTEPGALCTIFETLNRTGIKLSVFELLTARFWPENVNLRSLWETARKSYPQLEDFQVDPYYVLQAISLVCRKTPSCKRGDVLSLEGTDINRWWDKVVQGLALGIVMLRDDCKVLLPKWLPYYTMLPVLAGVIAKVGLTKGPGAGAQRQKLSRWFWCSVLTQAYESAANSQAARDFAELAEWLTGGPPPQNVSAFRFDPRALRDITPRQRSIYRGIICLLMATSRGVRDFHSQAIITSHLLNQGGIDDHHIFPNAYLQRRGIGPARLRDCVLNRTLIDRVTNQIIGDRAPSDYLNEIRQTVDFPFDDVLASHLLPTGPDSPLLRDDFEAFLSYRQAQLWRRIQEVTGATEPTELEDVNGTM